MPSRQTIKGITIKLGADATGLQSALEKINKNIDSTTSSLKDVAKLLKNDPGNTELLGQKQKLLNDQIGNTKKKLEALTSQQESLNKKLKNGDISQSQYDAWQREIVDTEQKLESLEGQLDDCSDKSGNFGDSLKNGLSNFKNAAVTINNEVLKPIADKIQAIGSESFFTFADFESSMAHVGAVTGATADEMELLKQKAMDVAKGSKNFGTKDIADAMGYMGMAGWKTEDIINGISTIEALATAQQYDLATTSDIVTDALTAFGYTAEDSAHFADVLTVASSNANTNVALMGETFKYVGAVAGSYGYSVDDVAESIGLMANQGIKASQAGTALRSIMSRIATNAGASKNKLGALDVITKELGSSFYDSNGKMRAWNDVINDCREGWNKLTDEQKANAAQMIAGKNGMSGWMALMNSSAADIEKLNTAITSADGATKQMKADMEDTANGSVEGLKSKIDVLKTTIGEKLAPTITKIVDKIGEVVDWINSWDDSDTKLALGIGATILVVSKFISWMTTLSTTIATIKTAIGVQKLVGTGSTMVSAAAAGGGLIGTIAGIGVVCLGVMAIVANLIAQIKMLSDNWDTIKEAQGGYGAIGTGQDIENVNHGLENLKKKNGMTNEDIGNYYLANGGEIYGTMSAYDSYQHWMANASNSVERNEMYKYITDMMNFDGLDYQTTKNLQRSFFLNDSNHTKADSNYDPVATSKANASIPQNIKITVPVTIGKRQFASAVAEANISNSYKLNYALK